MILCGNKFNHDNLIGMKELDRYEIVEGEHSLWKGVSRPYRETIHAFLAYFQNQVIDLHDKYKLIKQHDRTVN